MVGLSTRLCFVSSTWFNMFQLVRLLVDVAVNAPPITRAFLCSCLLFTLFPPAMSVWYTFVVTSVNTLPGAEWALERLASVGISIDASHVDSYPFVLLWSSWDSAASYRGLVSYFTVACMPNDFSCYRNALVLETVHVACVLSADGRERVRVAL